MAEMFTGHSFADVVDSSDELSRSVATSEDWSRSGDDVDDQLSGNELNELQKESDMPLEELLSIYGGQISTPYLPDTRPSPTGCMLTLESPNCSNRTFLSSSEDEILTKCDLTLDKDEITRDLLLAGNNVFDQSTASSCPVSSPQCSKQTPSSNFGKDVYLGHPYDNSLKTGTESPGHKADEDADNDEDNDSDDDDEDDDYVPELDSSCHQPIPVGLGHQALVPDNPCHFKNTPDSVGEGHLLWSPSVLPEYKVEKYCHEVKLHNRLLGAQVHSDDECGSIVDDEQGLLLLLQCNYNVSEALRRHHMQLVPPPDPLNAWSDEERTNFITGLRLYGKDFFLIQQNKVKTRSVRELVEFYYLWKTTDQYAAFSGKPRCRKRPLTPLPSRNISFSSPSAAANTPVHFQSSPTLNGLPFDLSVGQYDDICLPPNVPEMSSWLASPVYDTGTVLPEEAQPFRYDVSQHYNPKTAFSLSTYSDNFPELYYFPPYNAMSPRDCCSYERPAKRFCLDVAGSPVVGNVASSGELPTSASTALCFPAEASSSFPHIGQCNLVSHGAANSTSGDNSVCGYEMFAQ